MTSTIGWQRWMIWALLGVLLTACGSSSSTTSATNSNTASSASGTATNNAVKAVATTSILADLVRQVGGERVAVHTLLTPGTDPHTYAPTPSDVQAIAQSQIVFENGLGLEAWLEEVTHNAGGSRPTITVSQGLTPIAGGEHADEQHESTAHADHAPATTATADEQEDGHAESGADPHLWFDVQNTMRYVENIRDGLKQIDPSGAPTYDANAAAYIEQLKQVDSEIVKLVESVPAERRKLITNHDNFGYFARRYGFEVVGNVFEGVSTEQEPSAQQIARLVKLINEQQVPAIFTENTVNPRLAEQVANEAGIKVVTTLYTDALGQAGSDGETYIKMMRYNVQQIVAALK